MSPRESAYPGQRLDRPETGHGSLARPGRRFLSLVIDWVLCLGIGRVIFGSQALHGGSLIIVGVLAVENLILIGGFGATIGQWLVGVRVERLDGGRVGFTWVVFRTILLCLGFPPLTLIWEQDDRGLHDLASGSLVALR